MGPDREIGRHFPLLNGECSRQETVNFCFWWRTDEKGQVVFFVRIGWKPLEFEKGKAGVVAGTMEKLPGIIDTLIGAVRAGELDPMLEQAKTARPAPKKKAA